MSRPPEGALLCAYPSPAAAARPARGFSEHTQWLVDQEVAALLARAEARARDLLTRHREALTQLTAALLAEETITGDEVRALAAAGRAPQPIALPAGHPIAGCGRR